MVFRIWIVKYFVIQVIMNSLTIARRLIMSLAQIQINVYVHSM